MATEAKNALEELTAKFREHLKKRVVDVRLRNPAGHPAQLAMVRSDKKRIIVRAGRRGGKTVGAAIKAVEGFLKGRRVLYAAPTIDQVAKFWKEVQRALAGPIAYKLFKQNKTEHTIEKLGSEQRIRAKTAWNAETLRGDYADLLILDEYQMMDETAWTEVGAPMLIDNNGDVLFIYTPPSLETRSASKARDPQHAAKLYRAHKNDPDWLCLHFASAANPHISEEGIAEAAKNMTVLAYRQEILAQDIEEIPGALWTRKIIEDSRVKVMPCESRRIVIGIDPSGGNTTEVGIGVAAEGTDGHIYFLHDGSMKAARPKQWAQRAIQLYYAHQADRVVAERNYGGDMVEETLRNVDENVSYKDVTASRGKLVRAEPILALFQQKKMHLVGEWPELEEELVTYTADPRQKSPNRLDAMVWCGAELIGSGTLGLLDFYKTGRAQKVLEDRPVIASSKPEETKPVFACTNCKETTLQNVVGGGQVRCNHCGTQYWPDGKVPQFNVVGFGNLRKIQLPRRA
jgi:hypothetical protein